VSTSFALAHAGSSLFYVIFLLSSPFILFFSYGQTATFSTRRWLSHSVTSHIPSTSGHNHTLIAPRILHVSNTTIPPPHAPHMPKPTFYYTHLHDYGSLLHHRGNVFVHVQLAHSSLLPQSLPPPQLHNQIRIYADCMRYT